MLVKDQLNRTVQINSTNRIVSLVPSQTELLIDLGLEDKIVGVTKFCIHPKHLKKEKAIVGGTKDFSLSKIAPLKPDLIIGNKEENTKIGIEELETAFPVWLSDVKTLDDAKQMILQIGNITHTQNEAKLLVNEINLLESKIKVTSCKTKSVAYFIWKKPYMVAGTNNFINSILELMGYKNVFNQKDYARYPSIELEELKKVNPDVIILSSEPFPFKKKHIHELKNEFPQTEISIMDGEIFSWYGSRLIPSLQKILALKTKKER